MRSPPSPLLGIYIIYIISLLLHHHNHHLPSSFTTTHTSLIMDFIKKAAADFSSGNKGEQKPVVEGSAQQTTTDGQQPAQNVQKDDYVDKGEFSSNSIHLPMLSLDENANICLQPSLPLPPSPATTSTETPRRRSPTVAVVLMRSTLAARSLTTSPTKRSHVLSAWDVMADKDDMGRYQFNQE